MNFYKTLHMKQTLSLALSLGAVALLSSNKGLANDDGIATDKANLKKGAQFKGVTGVYPSELNPLSTQTTLPDLTESNLDSLLGSDEPFEFFDSAGNRHRATGSSSLQPENLKHGVELFGVTGTFANPNEFASERSVTITNPTAQARTANVVHFHLDTRDMVAKGKLQKNGFDLAFQDTNGNNLPFMFDGIGKKLTSFWIRVPTLSSGNTQVKMKFGNSHQTTDPRTPSVLHFFENFDGFNPQTATWDNVNGYSRAEGFERTGVMAEGESTRASKAFPPLAESFTIQKRVQFRDISYYSYPLFFKFKHGGNTKFSYIMTASDSEWWYNNGEGYRTATLVGTENTLPVEFGTWLTVSQTVDFSTGLTIGSVDGQELTPRPLNLVAEGAAFGQTEGDAIVGVEMLNANSSATTTILFDSIAVWKTSFPANSVAISAE